MPRTRKPVRGVWEWERGSEISWIRYRVDGILKREKVGAHGAAADLLRKPKNEIREDIKMPETCVRLRFASSPQRPTACATSNMIIASGSFLEHSET